jgi:hypothetical protein
LAGAPGGRQRPPGAHPIKPDIMGDRPRNDVPLFPLDRDRGAADAHVVGERMPAARQARPDGRVEPLRFAVVEWQHVVFG